MLDDKTDLNLGYFYYRADDFIPNYADGLPLGAGAEENSVTVRLTRRLTQQLRLNVKYAFTHYSTKLPLNIQLMTPMSSSPACNTGFKTLGNGLGKGFLP